MQPNIWYLLAGVAVIFVILAILFRRGSVEGRLDALGAKIMLKGQSGSSRSKAAPGTKPAVEPERKVEASGDGAVAVGGSADHATISAGVQTASRPKKAG
jgi:hypothetical protein